MYLGALNQSITKNSVLTIELINIFAGRNYTTLNVLNWYTPITGSTYSSPSVWVVLASVLKMDTLSQHEDSNADSSSVSGSSSGDRV
jgi:hypothetical protein